MRVVFVAPWIPSRIRPRSLGLLRELAAAHEVWFVGLSADGEIMEDLADLPLAGITTVPLSRASALARAGAALVKGGSLQVAFVREPALRAALAQVVDEFEPDVAHFNVIRSAAYLDVVGDMPVIFDLDEFRSDYYQQAARSAASLPSRVVARIEAPRMAKVENEVLERCEVALVSSPTDVRPDSKVRLVRSPHTVRALPHATGPDATILFVGRMGYAPNSQAVSWFIDQVLPAVVAAVPQATLTVVGENPPTSVQQRASDTVQVVGKVDDVSPYYATASVAIAPITVGSGVQMKLIQSLACAVPTVATSEAIRRAGITPGVEAFAANTAEQWVRSLVALLTSEPVAHRMAKAGQRWAEREYGPDAIAAALREAYNDLPVTDHYRLDDAA